MLRPVLVGARVEDKARSRRGFQITLGNAEQAIGPHMVFRSGSDDDSRIYLDLTAFTAWTGVQPNTALRPHTG